MAPSFNRDDYVAYLAKLSDEEALAVYDIEMAKSLAVQVRAAEILKAKADEVLAEFIEVFKGAEVSGPMSIVKNGVRVYVTAKGEVSLADTTRKKKVADTPAPVKVSAPKAAIPWN